MNTGKCIPLTYKSACLPYQTFTVWKFIGHTCTPFQCKDQFMFNRSPVKFTQRADFIKGIISKAQSSTVSCVKLTVMCDCNIGKSSGMFERLDEIFQSAKQ